MTFLAVIYLILGVAIIVMPEETFIKVLFYGAVTYFALSYFGFDKSVVLTLIGIYAAFNLQGWIEEMGTPVMTAKRAKEIRDELENDKMLP